MQSSLFFLSAFVSAGSLWILQPAAEIITLFAQDSLETAIHSQKLPLLMYQGAKADAFLLQWQSKTPTKKFHLEPWNHISTLCGSNNNHSFIVEEFGSYILSLGGAQCIQPISNSIGGRVVD